MGEAARVRPVFTVDDYLDYEEASPDKHEFVDGEILAMAGGSAMHHRIAARITTSFNVLLDDNPCEAVSSDQRIRTDEQGDYFYPDVTVYCEEAEFEPGRNETLLTPLVLFEVLSPSTSQYDRTTKLQAYRSIRSLTDYVIVWQDMVRVEHHSRTDTNNWQVQSFYRRAEIIHFRELGIELPVEQIYRNLDVPESVLSLDSLDS